MFMAVFSLVAYNGIASYKPDKFEVQKEVSNVQLEQVYSFENINQVVVFERTSIQDESFTKVENFRPVEDVGLIKYQNIYINKEIITAVHLYLTQLKFAFIDPGLNLTVVSIYNENKTTEINKLLDTPYPPGLFLKQNSKNNI